MSRLEDETQHFEFDPSSKDPSIALVEALAEVKDVDSTKVFLDSGTLQDYVNVDAVDTLLTGPQQEVIAVTFSVDHYDVRIRSNGGIEIRDGR